jgi:hypothetical protein
MTQTERHGPIIQAGSGARHHRQMTASDPASVSDEDAAATIGEIVNLVTGRIQALLSERGAAARCTLPRTERRQAAALAEPPDDSGFLLHLAIPRIDARLSLAVSASVAGAAAEGAG